MKKNNLVVQDRYKFKFLEPTKSRLVLIVLSLMILIFRMLYLLIPTQLKTLKLSTLIKKWQHISLKIYINVNLTDVK